MIGEGNSLLKIFLCRMIVRVVDGYVVKAFAVGAVPVARRIRERTFMVAKVSR